MSAVMLLAYDSCSVLWAVAELRLGAACLSLAGAGSQGQKRCPLGPAGECKSVSFGLMVSGSLCVFGFRDATLFLADT